ncbi:Hypothetical predicted protein [Podarcis lilfordi]|uniref:Uncharacterized protein n=1 Tax=Podarcis lilfordi TaxID=74358 RepID=A0AA35P9H9_9SAUR|nr:Hypothetical predicted protein [Podarcis lilfordi]
MSLACLDKRRKDVNIRPIGVVKKNMHQRFLIKRVKLPALLLHPRPQHSTVQQLIHRIRGTSCFRKKKMSYPLFHLCSSPAELITVALLQARLLNGIWPSVNSLMETSSVCGSCKNGKFLARDYWESEIKIPVL